MEGLGGQSTFSHTRDHNPEAGDSSGDTLQNSAMYSRLLDVDMVNHQVNGTKYMT